MYIHNVHVQEEYVVAAPKRKKLQPYDKFLKKFQYKNALDAVLKVYSSLLISYNYIESFKP